MREQKVRAIPGLDAEVESAISSALPALRARIPRVPLGRAVDGRRAWCSMPLRVCRASHGPIPVGSLRRGQDMVGDIEILAPTDRPADAIDALLQLPAASHVLHRSERLLYALADRVQIGVRLPATVQCRRRSALPDRIARALRGSAGACRRPGLTLDGRRAVLERRRRCDELRPKADIYAALGLPLIPPEIENGEDEIALATTGALPTLISRDDIRGDLHMHSVVERRTRSDRGDGRRRAARSATSMAITGPLAALRRRRAT